MALLFQLILLLSYEIKNVFSNEVVLEWEQKFPTFDKSMSLKIPKGMNSKLCHGGSGLFLKSGTFFILNQEDKLEDNSMRLLLYSPQLGVRKLRQCVRVFNGENLKALETTIVDEKRGLFQLVVHSRSAFIMLTRMPSKQWQKDNNINCPIICLQDALKFIGPETTTTPRENDTLGILTGYAYTIVADTAKYVSISLTRYVSGTTGYTGSMPTYITNPILETLDEDAAFEEPGTENNTLDTFWNTLSSIVSVLETIYNFFH